MVAEKQRSRLADWAPRLVPLLILGLFLVPFAWMGTFNGDQFTYMSHALRVVRGEVPYRDFFEFIPPLSFWLLAGVYALLGPSLWVTNTLQALLLWFSTWQLWDAARKLGVGPWSAWLPGAVLVMALYPHWSGFSHHWVVLPFVLGALQAGLHGLQQHSWKWSALAGLMTGLTLLTIHSDGIVLATTLLGFFWLYALLGGQSWRQAAEATAAFLGGLLAPVLLAALVLASQGALGAAWQSIWVWTTSNYKVQGGINYHPLLTDLPAVISPVKQLPAWYGRAFHFVFLFALPLGAAVFVIGWGLGMVWRRVRGGAPATLPEGRLGLVALVALGFVALATRGRADFIHVAFYAVPAALLVTSLAQAWRQRLPGDEWALLRWAPHGLLLAFVATGALMQVKTMTKSPGLWLSREVPDVRVTRAEVLDYLKAEAAPGDRVTAMPHGGYYYFYALPPATRYSVVFPPSMGYNPEAEFQAFGREIGERRPRFIIVAPWAWGSTASTRGRYEALFPPGYKLVKTVKTAQWGGIWPAYVYRDEGSKR